MEELDALKRMYGNEGGDSGELGAATPDSNGAADTGRIETQTVWPHEGEFVPSSAPSVRKFWVATAVMVLWVGFAVVLSLAWLAELAAVVGGPAAFVIIALLAYLPGALISFVVASLAQYRQPPLTVIRPTTGVTVLIAAFNEEAGIGATIRSLAAQDYDGPLSIVLADNGSTDGTVGRARAAAAEVGVELTVLHERTPGKSHALNQALLTVTTPYVITLDADTTLHPEALRRLVSRLESSPSDTAAVAGAVLVRNTHESWLSRMQDWDYRIGIAAVKRMQGMYDSTLVAQGAFSLYRTEHLRRVGGWPDAIGEDIVVTWRVMEPGYRSLYEPTALSWTDVPVTGKHLMRQRARWARGMFEGIAEVPPWRQRRPLTRRIAMIDLLIPVLDVGYGIVLVLGVLLALLGFPLIASWITLVLLPITLSIYFLASFWMTRKVSRPMGVEHRHNPLGFIGYVLLYQVLMSWAALAGYAQHLRGSSRRWK